MSEKILVTCPGCSKQYSFEAAKALGKRATCKGCGSQFVIDGGVSKKVPSYAEELLSRASSDQSANTEQPTTPKKSEPPPIPASGEVVHKRTSTRAALAIVAAVVLLTLSAPFVAMFFGSLLFPKAPIAAVVPAVSPPVVEPEAEEPPNVETPKEEPTIPEVVESEPAKILKLNVEETWLMNLMTKAGMTPILIEKKESFRVYRCTTTKLRIRCNGYPENLESISATISTNDIHDAASIGIEKIKDLRNAFGVITMAVRPELSQEIEQTFVRVIPSFMKENDKIRKTKLGVNVDLATINSDFGNERFFVLFISPEEE